MMHEMMIMDIYLKHEREYDLLNGISGSKSLESIDCDNWGQTTWIHAIFFAD